jgi:hypothetical protein
MNLNRRQLLASLFAAPAAAQGTKRKRGWLSAPVTLAELDRNAPTFGADCESVAAQFIAESGEPRLNIHHELIMAAVRSAAGRIGDAFDAIYDGIVILPYTEPSLAHLCRDVMELKAQGADHELFHVPSGTPILDILPLFDGHTWTMPR